MKTIFLIALSLLTVTNLSSQNLFEIDSGIKISNTVSQMPEAGTIRWTGTDFQGYNGHQWQSLTSGNNSIISYFLTLPNGIQTLLDSGESITNILAAGANTDEFLGLKYLGGFIFKLETDGTGLMTTSNDYHLSYNWGCYGSFVYGADGTSIGTGAQNTIDIINHDCIDTSTAAHISDTYIDNDLVDWYLPSRDELLLMWSVLGDQDNGNIGGFQHHLYWSSSEYSWTEAWAVKGWDGESQALQKDLEVVVRPIRNF